MKLILVGAGPGDPDLITLKGLKALQKAKSVLYDALVHPDLLLHCPPGTVQTDVGKRYGKSGCRQEQINTLIAAYAAQYGEVIRLKGGDPFIFGRGYEEIAFAASHGITSEVIPGLSSSYSVPALSGIPLTTRGWSESFWVITGTTKNHVLSQDIALAAQSTATVVILMGVHHLPEIVEIYRDLGRTQEPIAIIQNGSLPQQKIARGTIATILKVAQQQAISSPAILVIGPVAKLEIPEIQEQLTGIVPAGC